MGSGQFAEEKAAEETPTVLSQADQDTLCAFLRDALGTDRVKEVRVTNRLSDSPCIVTDHESAALRRMMRMVVSGVACMLIATRVLSYCHIYRIR